MTGGGGQSPWARHYQKPWQEHARAPELPDWLRLACLAYGRHRANGHACFLRGEVAQLLARVDTDTGVITPRVRQHVHRAIKTAIGHGFLADGSTARCLIVPAHKITGGMGNPNESCPVHSLPTVRKRRQPRSAASGHTSASTLSGDAGTGTSPVNGDSRHHSVVTAEPVTCGDAAAPLDSSLARKPSPYATATGTRSHSPAAADRLSGRSAFFAVSAPSQPAGSAATEDCEAGVRGLAPAPTKQQRDDAAVLRRLPTALCDSYQQRARADLESQGLPASPADVERVAAAFAKAAP